MARKQHWNGSRGRSAYVDVISGNRRGLLASAARTALGALSEVYRAASYLRGRLQRLSQTRLPCKVISVGNITVGGTGKTPMVQWIARKLRESGRRVAIVSRGYGAGVSTGMNDEGKMLAENLDAVPHVQDKNRLAACKVVIKNYDPEVIILDDAFQHHRLARDLDVVMIDATAPFGYGRVLPRGLLRESPKGLRRADMVIISRSDQVSKDAVEALCNRIRVFAPEITIAESVHEPVSLYNLSDRTTLRLDWFLWNRAAAFCGIANPAAFRNTLASLDCIPTLFEIFPDHNNYTRRQIEEFVARAVKSGADAVVTTQKDAVKLAEYTNLKLPILELKVELRLKWGGDILTEWLDNLLHSSPHAAHATARPGSRRGPGNRQEHDVR